jgi:hypothetical protein
MDKWSIGINRDDSRWAVACVYLGPKGFKSVTLSQDTYDFFYRKYRRNRVMLRRQGIRSFSAYLSFELFLADDVERDRLKPAKNVRPARKKAAVRGS